MQENKRPKFPSSFIMRWQSLPPRSRLILLTTTMILVAIISVWPKPYIFKPQQIPLALNLETMLAQMSTVDMDFDLEQEPTISHTVELGDTLGGLFESVGISQQTMFKVLESDLDILALDTLQVGDQVRFWIDDQQNLTKLELYFNASHQVEFSLQANGSYEFKDIHINGVWQNRLISGNIYGSLYKSAERSGLTASEIQRIEGLLKGRINFARDLRAGDTFSVLLNDQYIEGEPTGNSQILGVRVNNKGKTLSAFRDAEGNFYDEKGRSLESSFQRIPLQKNYRISSNFNPYRKHPVTGRVTHHNGTDFATPVGTKVVAPGDGVVSLVTNHRYAGKYIVIDHGDKYRTRFLHLSKIKVRKGQRVKRGQVIGLTGNTGRTTGAHLHYELHVNGRPVNPMKAKIPTASNKLSSKKLREFKKIVKARETIMDLG